MDPASILHTYTKLVAEGRINSTNAAVPECLPPPYTPADDSASDADSDTEEEETDDLHLKINASTTIHGSNNLVSIPQLDSARLSAILVSALRQHAGQSQTMKSDGSMRATKVNVEINCGISITGDRNVVGNVPISLRRRQGENVTCPASSAMPVAPIAEAVMAATAGASTGAKRRADGDGGNQPSAKRVDVKTEEMS